MKDLRDAIKAVIDGAIRGEAFSSILVSEEDFKVLVAEYNIHFVEPEDEQVEMPN